ncbi:MAG: VWA domain-containing protein [Minicystis sp.]
MTDLKEFTVSSARPLPVIVLADISGSMTVDGKIQSLNQAMREMLEAFRDEDDLRAEIHIAVITFGGGQVKRHLPLGPASSASWSDLPAGGDTPMGAAFDAAREMIEDRTVVPGRSYRPTLVLLSDGQPTDAWQAPLTALLGSDRGGKAFRMALAIGADADQTVLSAFLHDPEARVFRADEARQIRRFFRFVTMSVTARSRSANPNVASKVPPDEEWDL